MAYSYGDPTADAKTFLSYAGVNSPSFFTIAAVSAWLQKENGLNNNVLGVTTPSGGVSKLLTFPTKDAGLKAAAGLLTGGARYQAAEERLKANDATGFIREIALSGWNAPKNYGIKGNDVTTVNWYPLYQKTQTSMVIDEYNPSVGLKQLTGNVQEAANTATGGILGNIFKGAETAVLFIGIVLVGIVFLGGSFYLAKK